MADDKSDDCFIKKLESAYSSYKSIETYVMELRAKIDRVGGSTPRNVFGVIYVSFHLCVFFQSSLPRRFIAWPNFRVIFLVYCTDTAKDIMVHGTMVAPIVKAS